MEIRTRFSYSFQLKSETYPEIPDKANFLEPYRKLLGGAEMASAYTISWYTEDFETHEELMDLRMEGGFSSALAYVLYYLRLDSTEPGRKWGKYHIAVVLPEKLEEKGEGK